MPRPWDTGHREHTVLHCCAQPHRSSPFHHSYSHLGKSHAPASHRQGDTQTHPWGLLSLIRLFAALVCLQLIQVVGEMRCPGVLCGCQAFLP